MRGEIGVDSEEALEADLAEFARHERKGGWALALLIAKRVEPGTDNGVGLEQLSTNWFSRTVFRRISAREFARRTHSSHRRVMAYWKAWERAAADGIVDPAFTLEPGRHVELPDEDTVPFFGEKGYYRSYEAREVSSERVRAIEEEAERAGIKATAPVSIATQPKALTAAVVADATARGAAQEGLDEFHRRQAEQDQADRDAARRTAQDRRRGYDRDEEAEVVQAVRQSAQAASEADAALDVFNEITAIRLGTLRTLGLLQRHQIAFTHERSQSLAGLCDAATAAIGFIRDLVTSNSTALNDAALQAFLDESEKKLG
ncbi:hypothetical protein [Streptomyces caatingaensis]|uniref:Uncharacterized protein n=1 Tax=Streptomyces caatingaensis TaxID=1678637 RepID=A0A0K9X6D0_9ACTN|nr:hypothetical protein [Streptomyces caatingaensis]KNB49024.1 hypothetical protein AC230_27130 [Streptomyces caatingaensis]KNB52428.1 hypothetical protein AC230_10730 [Streptomyces caatingaensis]